MRSTVLEKNLIAKLEESIRDVTPGVVVRAIQNGQVVCDIAVGNTFPYYDFASLTKPIFAVQACLWAYEQNKFNLEDPIQKFLPWFPSTETTLKELLTHSSGLPARLMWFETRKPEAPWMSSKELAQEISQCKIADLPADKKRESVYSDVGFAVVGLFLEEIYQKSLFEIWSELFGLFFEGTTLRFHKDNEPSFNLSDYAPTEECPWRKKLVRGQVHDENAFVMGGVATHAGLFGSIDDLAWYGLLLRSQCFGIGKSLIKLKTIKKFAHRAIDKDLGDWAMGWMMPTPGEASCGNYFSLESLGHTGFTGTSIWFDPKSDLQVSVLSNRVLYGRENLGFRDLRPQIHNWVVEGIRKYSVIGTRSI